MAPGAGPRAKGLMYRLAWLPSSRHDSIAQDKSHGLSAIHLLAPKTGQTLAATPSCTSKGHMTLQMKHRAYSRRLIKAGAGTVLPHCWAVF